MSLHAKFIGIWTLDRDRFAFCSTQFYKQFERARYQLFDVHSNMLHVHEYFTRQFGTADVHLQFLLRLILSFGVVNNLRATELSWMWWRGHHSYNGLLHEGKAFLNFKYLTELFGSLLLECWYFSVLRRLFNEVKLLLRGHS